MELNEQNFEQEVLKHEGVALVDFFATWCGPCQTQGPIIDELAEEMAGKATVGKVDIDKASPLAEKYDVMSVPTLLLFKNGEVKETLTGLQNKEVLKEKIEALI